MILPKPFTRLLIQTTALAVLAAGTISPSLAQSVYVLTGGNSSTDQMVANSLRAAGFNVTIGVQTPSWNATQANLSSYDSLVMLNNINWRGKMATEGAASIRDYISAGGGLITGEWMAYNAQYNSIIADFMPADYAGFLGDDSLDTDFTNVEVDSTLSEGLSGKFKVKKGSAEGTESKLRAKANAKVFYSSSASGGAGLVGWNYGQGKVLAFSSILTGDEIDNNDLKKLISNAGKWTARQKQGDGGGGTAVTPEGSSLALFACGILPFGLLWARRRARSPW